MGRYLGVSRPNDVQLVGTLSTLLSIAAGTLVGQAYDGTVTPLVVGFGILSFLSIAATTWAEPRSDAA